MPKGDPQKSSGTNPSFHFTTCPNTYLPSNLKSLSLNPTFTPAPPPDSWEEEAFTPTSSTPSSPSSPLSIHRTKPSSAGIGDTEFIPSAPPPTPISPTHRTHTKPTTSQNLDNIVWDNPYGAPTSPTPTSLAGNQDGRRPEKSTAAAGRMIAAGLGVRQPKKSEENRAYEKAVREKEKKRRELEKVQAKEMLEEAERAKRGIWEN